MRPAPELDVRVKEFGSRLEELERDERDEAGSCQGRFVAEGEDQRPELDEETGPGGRRRRGRHVGSGRRPYEVHSRRKRKQAE